jgi:Ion channel
MNLTINSREPGIPSGPDLQARPWFRRYPVAFFLVALVLSFLASPFEDQFRDGDLVEAVRLTVVVLSGLLAVSDRRRTLAWGILLVTPAVVGKWLNHGWPDLVPAWVFLAPGVVFCVFVILHLLRFVIRAARVDSEVLCAGVAGYLMVGILWGLAYILVGVVTPAAFAFSATPGPGQSMKGFTALYFSFITLTTVGYGDIVPASGASRMLAMTEAMTGTLYIAVLIARLVSLYSAAKPSRAANDPEGP